MASFFAPTASTATPAVGTIVDYGFHAVLASVLFPVFFPNESKTCQGESCGKRKLDSWVRETEYEEISKSSYAGAISQLRTKMYNPNFRRNFHIYIDGVIKELEEISHSECIVDVLSKLKECLTAEDKNTQDYGHGVVDCVNKDETNVQSSATCSTDVVNALGGKESESLLRTKITKSEILTALRVIFMDLSKILNTPDNLLLSNVLSRINLSQLYPRKEDEEPFTDQPTKTENRQWLLPLILHLGSDIYSPNFFKSKEDIEKLSREDKPTYTGFDNSPSIFMVITSSDSLIYNHAALVFLAFNDNSFDIYTIGLTTDKNHENININSPDPIFKRLLDDSGRPAYVLHIGMVTNEIIYNLGQLPRNARLISDRNKNYKTTIKMNGEKYSLTNNNCAAFVCKILGNENFTPGYSLGQMGIKSPIWITPTDASKKQSREQINIILKALTVRPTTSVPAFYKELFEYMENNGVNPQEFERYVLSEYNGENPIRNSDTDTSKKRNRFGFGGSQKNKKRIPVTKKDNHKKSKKNKKRATMRVVKKKL
jgi:hypothetical protein